MNRKAAVSALIADIYAILVFALVSAAFFALFKIGIGGHAEYIVKSIEMDVAPQASCISYLRAPVNFQGNNITVAELAAWSFNNKNYTMLNEFTNNLLGEFTYFRIYICDAVAYDTWKGPGVFIDPDICPYSMVQNPLTWRTQTYLGGLVSTQYRAYRTGVARVEQRIANVDKTKNNIMIVFEAQ
jgi:hypothetical protein